MQDRPLLPVYRASARALYIAILNGTPRGHVYYSAASGNRPEWRCGTCGDKMKRSQQIIRHVRSTLVCLPGWAGIPGNTPFSYTKIMRIAAPPRLGRSCIFDHPVYHLWWFPLTDFTCTTPSELLPRLIDATTLQTQYGATWVRFTLPEHL